MTPALSWSKDYNPSIHGGAIPLYTSPPQRQWVGLTHDEAVRLSEQGRGGLSLIREVEEILKERNSQ
jgi:hypothetical protein